MSLGKKKRADRTLVLLNRGYDYLLNQRLRMHTDSLRLRLLGGPATIVSGAEGARLFYDESAMQRHDATPAFLANTLFGKGAVHGLDDRAHKHRKAMFTSLLTPDEARSVASLAAQGWERAAGGWRPGQEIKLFDTAVGIHAAAICEWAGVPTELLDADLADDLVAMVDGFGSVGRRAIRARRARRRADAWAGRVIAEVATRRVAAPANSAVRRITDHVDDIGRRLPTATAAVELLNILRPTVAVAYFVEFAALSLVREPDLASHLAAADDPALESFAHEVRRYFPFVPALAARARHPVPWRDSTIPEGQRVVLDVYGTLHDPALWTDPGRFDASRFTGTDPDPWVFIPQGGGDPETGHRCPGERMAIELIKAAARFLATSGCVLLANPQSVPLTRMPSRPREAIRVGPAGGG
jgi:fatty-acid peroxygenase